MLRVGIFSGAFAPIHKGHVEAARAFLSQMWLDVLFVVPTCCETLQGASDEDRIECCRIAFRDIDGVIVSDVGIRRGDTDFSAEALRDFSDDDRRLFLLCGTDGMLTLGERNDAGEIFKFCYPVYVRRESDKRLDGEIIAKNQEYFEKYGRYVIKLDTPAIEISSSKLRMMMRQGGDGTEFMDSEVLKYIENKGLYR